MQFDEYKAQLSMYLDEISPDQECEESVLDLPISAPFDNFFNNDLLLLAFHSNDNLPSNLNEVRHHLYAASNEQGSDDERANAAVEIGRFVRKMSFKSNFRNHSDQAKKWFEFAAEYKSVIGVTELANELLAHKKIKVITHIEEGLLPQLVAIDENNLPRTLEVDRTIYNTWRGGMRLALRFANVSFEEWDNEHCRAALTCIVNFLTFMPYALSGIDSKTTIANKQATLKWVRPIWDSLISRFCDHSRVSENIHEQLLDQQRAILVTLSPVLNVTARVTTDKVRDIEVLGSDSISVIKGLIPMGSDKDDIKVLQLYQELRKPVKLTPLPSMDRLLSVSLQLKGEFPWATDAIDVTMAEMFARKRHGSKRLGMQPVLLIGTPGTGKTRFAQRLSELLGTPHTVINMAGMTDTKVLKGVTRGWASNRPSRIVEFMLQHRVANPMFILDEVDKATGYFGGNSGDPQDALLDLLEPGNAKRYADIYLMTECDVSNALYVLTANTLATLSEPLKSRLRMVIFPAPGPEHAAVIVQGVLGDLELAWNVPQGTVTLTPSEMSTLVGLSPREMRRAILEFFGQSGDAPRYTQH